MSKGEKQRLLTESQWILVGLLLCLLIGITLRFHALGTESLWNDELESWRQSSYPTLTQVLEQGSIPDTHPPLFQVILYYVERGLGSGEVMLRLPSAVAGTLTILAMFFLGEAAFGNREGLIGAFLTAVLWVPVSYSQEARNYAILLLFSTLAGYFWIRILQKILEGESIGIRLGLGYGISALLTCYTHYFGVLLIILQGVAALIYAFHQRNQRRQTIALYALVLLGYMPWLPYLVLQLGHAERIAWMRLPGLTFFPAFISFLFNRINALGLLVIAAYGFLLGSVLWRSGQGPLSQKIRRLMGEMEIPLAYWLLVPVGIAYIVSLVFSPVYTQRNLMIALPPAYLLLARAITRLTRRTILQIALVGVFGGLPLLHMIFIQGYYKYPYKEQFREAIEYVVMNNDPDQNEAVIGNPKYPDYFTYYFERFDSGLRLDVFADGIEALPLIDQFLDQSRSDRFWYIAVHGMPDSELVAALESEYPLLDEKSYQGAHVWKFAVPEE
jgi:mannosyltransferase